MIHGVSPEVRQTSELPSSVEHPAGQQWRGQTKKRKKKNEKDTIYKQIEREGRRRRERKREAKTTFTHCYRTATECKGRIEGSGAMPRARESTASKRGGRVKRRAKR